MSKSILDILRTMVSVTVVILTMMIIIGIIVGFPLIIVIYAVH